MNELRTLKHLKPSFPLPDSAERYDVGAYPHWDAFRRYVGLAPGADWVIRLGRTFAVLNRLSPQEAAQLSSDRFLEAVEMS